MNGISFTAVLAHQGGWDEILLIAGPIVVIVGLLMLARKRVNEAARSDEGVERRADGTAAGGAGSAAASTGCAGDPEVAGFSLESL